MHLFVARSPLVLSMTLRHATLCPHFMQNSTATTRKEVTMVDSTSPGPWYVDSRKDQAKTTVSGGGFVGAAISDERLPLTCRVFNWIASLRKAEQRQGVAEHSREGHRQGPRTLLLSLKLGPHQLLPAASHMTAGLSVLCSFHLSGHCVPESEELPCLSRGKPCGWGGAQAV